MQGVCCKCKPKLNTRNSTKVLELDTFDHLNVISLLTGWYPSKRMLDNKTPEEIWNFMIELLEQYQYPNPKNKLIGKKLSTNHVDEEAPIFPLIVTTLQIPSNYMDIPAIELHQLNTLQIRAIPLVKPPVMIPLAAWKPYRWVDWAIEQGLYEIEDPNKDKSLLVTVVQMRKFLFDSFANKEWHESVNSKGIISAPGLTENGGTRRKSAKGKRKMSVVGGVIGGGGGEQQMWLDFNRIFPHIKFVEVYEKDTKYLKNFIISNEPSDVSLKSKTKSPKSGGKSTIVTEEDEIAGTITRISTTDSSFVYIFVDDLTDIIANITFTNMKVCPDTIGYVICEKFDWTADHQELFFILSTGNSTSQTIVFPRGRHIFRLQFVVEHFSINLRCNSKGIHIGTLLEIIDAMNSECCRFIEYFENLSIHFERYITTVGLSDDFRMSLIEFYKTILFNSNENWRETNSKVFRNYIFLTFEIKILEKLRSINDEASRILFTRFFISPKSKSCVFNFCYHKANCYHMTLIYNQLKKNNCNCDCRRGEIFDSDYVHEVECYSATKIQSIMKMRYILSLIKYHDRLNYPEKWEHFLAMLMEFYQNYFLKNFLIVYEIIREFMMSTFESFEECHGTVGPIHQIGDLFNFFPDMKNSIKLVLYNGLRKIVPPKSLIPLAQGNLICQSNRLERYLILLTIITNPDAEESGIVPFVRIFNNDSLMEVSIDRNTNTIDIQRNNSGYTIHVYCWTDLLLLDLKWSVRIVHPRHVMNLKTETQLNQLIVKQFDEMFWPNSANEICRFRIKIGTTGMFSIFLTTSYPLLKFKVMIFCKMNGETVYEEVQSNGVVILGIILKQLHEIEDVDFQNDTARSKKSTKSQKLPQTIITDIETTDYILVVRVLDEWILPDEEKSTIYKSIHEEIDYRILNEQLQHEEEKIVELQDQELLDVLRNQLSEERLFPYIGLGHDVPLPNWRMIISHDDHCVTEIESDQTIRDEDINFRKALKETGVLEEGLDLQMKFKENRKIDSEKCLLIEREEEYDLKELKLNRNELISRNREWINSLQSKTDELND